MKIVTLLIDDDTDSRMIARTFIEKHCPQLLIAGEAGSVEEGIKMIDTYRPELLLLDIEMPDGSGFNLLQQVAEKNFEVIFITAYQAYAIEAFKYSAVGYLLKPVSIQELKETVEKAVANIQKKLFEAHWLALSHNLQQHNNYDRKLAIATSTGFAFVNVKEIIRCHALGNYTEFYFSGDKKMLSSRNLGFYEELLPPEKFCRVHHSHLINIDFIEKFNKRTNGGTVSMTDQAEIDVSQRRKETLLQHFLNKQ